MATPDNWDGVKMEEEKAWSMKKEANNVGYLVFQGVCLKNCRNRDIKCNDCLRFSEFIEGGE